MEGAGAFIYIAIFFAILYFLMIRPQQKQQKKRKQMLEELKVDDAIVTIGGIHGRITKMREDYITVRIADKIEVDFDKTAVGYVKGKE
ncbi:preprotein translocase subunit YajC [Desulfitibacter alkalitolerans]|uniref:preprotein translocase subunit YajC n=1 Tax=Desulfitibacter alkalitolerans TaxID=264641 RepID=UPI0004828119|nr:preprotein translocase subunit YajC [Desulfitibacter alkalitolerans]